MFLVNIGISQDIINGTIYTNGDADSLDYDTSYIASYRDVFTLRLLTSDKKNSFNVTEEKDGNTIEYEPNSTLNLGFGFTYKWLGLNLAFNFPFINNDDEIYGETSRLDIQTSIFTRKYVVDLFFQYYDGYYVANPTLIDPSWLKGDPYPIRGDITSTSLGGSLNYVFKHNKFSYRAAFNFNERQKKSAGSFTVGGGVFIYGLNADSSLVPNELFPDSVLAIDIRGIRINSLYGLGGYAHTFVIRNWYFTLALGLGPGLSSTKTRLSNDDFKKVRSRFSVITEFRGSVGYNSDVFYAGLSWYTGAFAIDSPNELLITYSLSKINFYVGYRFYKWFNKENKKQF
jgi:hypothetical protein